MSPNYLAGTTLVELLTWRRTAELANDVLGLSLVFGDVYPSVINVYRAWQATRPPLVLEIRDVGALNYDTSEAGMKLKAMYKALFYSLRAYQDGIYKVLLEITGQKSGAGSRMIDAIHTPTKKPRVTNQVGKVLNDACPEYADWFMDLRAKRNYIKGGVNLSIHGPIENLGIGFNTLRIVYLKNNKVVSKDEAYDEKVCAIGYNADDDRVVRVNDVTKALTMSRRVVAIALEQAQRQTARRN